MLHLNFMKIDHAVEESAPHIEFSQMSGFDRHRAAKQCRHDLSPNMPVCAPLITFRWIIYVGIAFAEVNELSFREGLPHPPLSIR